MIEAELRKLEGIANQPASRAAGSPPTRWRSFPGFWQKAKQISELFQTTDLAYEDRARLWKQHQNLCDHVSAVRLRERNADRKASNTSRTAVMSILDAAHQSLRAMQSEADFTHIRQQLDRALSLLKQSFFLGHDRDHCWNAWRELDRRLMTERRRFVSSSSRPRRPAENHVVGKTVEFLASMREGKVQAREKLLREIDGLEDDINEAWKLGWAARAKTWVEGKRLKVEQITIDIADLDRQIQRLKRQFHI